jgi:DNA-binding beta-propeller fold protein YncE
LKASAASLPIFYTITGDCARANDKEAAKMVPEYTLDSNWPPAEDGFKFDGPNGIAVSSDDRIFVVGGAKNPVLVFSPDGKLLDQWGRGIICGKHELRIYGDKIYICDASMHQVYEFSLDGTLLRTFGQRGKPGLGKDQFNKPTCVAVAPNGDFYITDGYGNRRIVCLSPEGQFKFAWGTEGDKPGQFKDPHTLVIDKNNRIIVADRENFRIQLFDLSGKFLGQWTNVGRPFGVYLRNDIVYVTDGTLEKPNRVLMLDLDGKLLGEFGTLGSNPGEFDVPHSLAIDSKGNIYVAEVNNRRVQKFVPKK